MLYIFRKQFNMKTAIEDRNEFFVLMFMLWDENGFGSRPFGVKSFDCANREIGAPGNRFLPLKWPFWEGGRPRPPERKTGR